MKNNSTEIILQFHISLIQENGKKGKHKAKDKKTSNIEYIISILILLYVDNATVPFKNRNGMIKGLKIIDNIMSKLELTIRKGADRKKV